MQHPQLPKLVFNFYELRHLARARIHFNAGGEFPCQRFPGVVVGGKIARDRFKQALRQGTPLTSILQERDHAGTAAGQYVSGKRMRVVPRWRLHKSLRLASTGTADLPCREGPSLPVDLVNASVDTSAERWKPREFSVPVRRPVGRTIFDRPAVAAIYILKPKVTGK